jgi:predicted site-specific integrase-resolvase
LEVLHDECEQSVEQELMDDFMSLIACFSRRVYGQRSAAARRRLLQEAQVK